MHDCRMTRSLALMATWLESTGARETASTLRALHLKVAGFRTENRCSWVAGTTESQFRSDCIRIGELRVDIGPHWDIEVCFRISDEIHAVLSPTEEHVDSIFGA